MERLTIEDRTEILIVDTLPESLLPSREGRTRVAILTQPSATPLATRIGSALQAEGLLVEVIGLPDREEAKTLEVVASVYEALTRFGLGRLDTIVGVGGGALTDVAGFVAGTWNRGVESVYVSTTLLGAVDASVGGKTGVNSGGKNLVGVFWHPSRVIIDTTQLGTLPSFLIREGMAEAFKAGLVGDPDLAQLIADSGLRSPLADVVKRALAVKVAIVSRDEREAGIRAYLNFGHTIGHALEFSSALSHGEAVGLGMVAAAHISQKNAGFSHVHLVEETVASIGLPPRVEGFDLTRVMDLMRRDKKRDEGGTRMVLLTEIGEPFVTHVDRADVELGLSAIGL